MDKEETVPKKKSITQIGINSIGYPRFIWKDFYAKISINYCRSKLSNSNFSLKLEYRTLISSDALLGNERNESNIGFTEVNYVCIVILSQLAVVRN